MSSYPVWGGSFVGGLSPYSLPPACPACLRGFRVRREMRYRLSEVQAWVEAMEALDHAADRVGRSCRR